MTATLSRPELVTGPATEPVTTTEAKKHLEISGSDHDGHVDRLIQAAREQWEHDTQQFLVSQTWRQYLDGCCEFRFQHRPVSAITSVTYYDSSNASQTLASSVYELDTANNRFRLKPDQDWPVTYTRWDAVTVNYTMSGIVKEIDKQAVLLLVGFYFENRDMLMSEAMQSLRSYELLVRRFMRSSYP